MSKITGLSNFFTVVLTATTFAACASPCDGVDRNLTNERKAVLAPEIAKQLQVPTVDVLQSFRKDTWSIFYIDTRKADEVFLFYASDPLTSHYVTVWSGAARTNQEQEIKDWTIKQVPDIPTRLADCFAWYVTKGRSR